MDIFNRTKFMLFIFIYLIFFKKRFALGSILEMKNFFYQRFLFFLFFNENQSQSESYL